MPRLVLQNCDHGDQGLLRDVSAQLPGHPSQIGDCDGRLDLANKGGYCEMETRTECLTETVETPSSRRGDSDPQGLKLLVMAGRRGLKKQVENVA